MRADDYRVQVIASEITSLSKAMNTAIENINKQLGTVTNIVQSQSSTGSGSSTVVTVTILYKLGSLAD